MTTRVAANQLLPGDLVVTPRTYRPLYEVARVEKLDEARVSVTGQSGHKRFNWYFRNDDKVCVRRGDAG